MMKQKMPSGKPPMKSVGGKKSQGKNPVSGLKMTSRPGSNKNTKIPAPGHGTRRAGSGY